MNIVQKTVKIFRKVTIIYLVFTSFTVGKRQRLRQRRISLYL